MTRATSPPLVNVNALGLPNTGNNQNDVDDCTYWDHSAPIDGNGPNGEATIEQCLEAHTREETLGGDGGGNRYYCERCQAVTSATKRTSLNRDCPKVLVLHLKRFMWKGKSGQRAKIIAPVAFPPSVATTTPSSKISIEEYSPPFAQARLASQVGAGGASHTRSNGAPAGITGQPASQQAKSAVNPLRVGTTQIV